MTEVVDTILESEHNSICWDAKHAITFLKRRDLRFLFDLHDTEFEERCYTRPLSSVKSECHSQPSLGRNAPPEMHNKY